MRKSALKKVGPEEGRDKLTLSGPGPRRGVRGEVNLPTGYGGSENPSEEWKTG